MISGITDDDMDRWDKELELGSSKSTSTPAVESDPIPDTTTTEVVSDAVRDEEVNDLKKRTGMAGTVLTSSSGTLGTVANQTAGLLGISGV